MSLRAAGSIASAALMANSAAASVTSQNVANASTDGYTKKTANMSTTDTGTGFYGVTVSSVSSSVDQLLLKSVVQNQSTLGETKALDTYLDQVQSALGSVSSTTGLGSQLDTLATACSTLASSPSSSDDKSAVVEALVNTATKIKTTSNTIQDTRLSADKAITTSVTTINNTLDKIDSLNDQIVEGKARGEAVGDAEDQRAELLKTLATNIDINYQTDSNGAVRISTSSGATLLDSSVHELSHTSAGSMSSSTVYSSAGGSGIDGIMLDGKDITSSIQSGTLKGLVQLRDTTLPAQQAALDNLATTLITKVNAVNNAGSPTPAPTTLTGTRTVSTTTPPINGSYTDSDGTSHSVSASGKVHMMLVDTDGTVQESYDLDLSSNSTPDDVKNAIESNLNVTVSYTSDNKMELTVNANGSGVTYGLAMAGDDDVITDTATTASGTTTTTTSGLSAYFGLNDLLTGTSAADIAVTDQALDNRTLVSSSMASTTATAGSSTDSVGVTVSEGTAATNLAKLFTASQSFSKAGDLSARTETFSSYAGDFISSVATSASTASDKYDTQNDYVTTLESSFSSESGVNLDEETANLSAIESAYQAAASVMKTLQTMFDAALNMKS